MIWKLCKTDIRSTWRSYCIMYLILFLASVILQFTTFSTSGISITTSLIAILFYSGTIMALCFSFIINMMKNFYQSMFGKQSYLTQTLPVSATQLLLSKLMMGLFWILISLVMILLSQLILFVGFSARDGVGSLSGMIQAITSEFSDFGEWMNIGKLGLYIIVLLTNNILLLFLIFTIVHTCYIRGNRILIGILIYFLMGAILGYLQTTVFGIEVDINFGLQQIFLLLLSAGYFLASRYLLEHKMDLE